MKKNKEPIPKRIDIDAQELAYCLVDLGDAMGCIKRKAYLPAYTRIAQSTKRIRKLLKVEGEDEK